MITSWTELLTELTRLMDGEDTTASNISPGTLTQLVYMAELRIYRQLRTRYNEKAWGTTVTSNAMTLPADFVASSVLHFGGKPCEPVSEEFLLEYLNANPTGDTLYFAKAGSTLVFGPSVANGTAVQGRYYYKLPALTPASLPSNALFAVAEDLFVYCALAESAPFFGQDARIPLWEAKYASVLEQLNKNDHVAAYSAGRMRTRPSTNLKR